MFWIFVAFTNAYLIISGKKPVASISSFQMVNVDQNSSNAR